MSHIIRAKTYLDARFVENAAEVLGAVAEARADDGIRAAQELLGELGGELTMGPFHAETIAPDPLPNGSNVYLHPARVNIGDITVHDVQGEEFVGILDSGTDGPTAGFQTFLNHKGLADIIPELGISHLVLSRKTAQEDTWRSLLVIRSDRQPPSEEPVEELPEGVPADPERPQPTVLETLLGSSQADAKPALTVEAMRRYLLSRRDAR